MQLWLLTTFLSVLCQVVPTSSTSSQLRSRAPQSNLHSWNLHPWVDSDFGLAFSGKPEERETFSIIVWGATLETREDTKLNEGLFCVLRYGPPKSSWDDKIRGTGRISNTSQPMARSPTWNLGTLVTGSDKTELSVRIYALDGPELSLPELRGKNLQGKRRLLGQISVGIRTLRQASRNSVDGKASFKLPGGGHVRLTAIRGGVQPSFALADYGLSPSTSFEVVAPIAGQQAVRVEDINAQGPLILGTAPLPPALQGIWWISGSSLLSFGGSNNDANGCSLGYLGGDTNSYKIRAEGDRVMASSDPSGLDKIMETGDKSYYFEFDNAVNPTNGQVYTLFEGMGVDTKDSTENIMSSQMSLLPEGDVEYPGSLVWLRNTSLWGISVARDIKIVQLMDGAGEKIEPAWSKFVAFAKDSENRDYPGWMFYKSVTPVSSPWAVAVAEELLQKVRFHMILIVSVLLILAGGLCAAGGYGCVLLHRSVRLLDVWQQGQRLTPKQSYWIH